MGKSDADGREARRSDIDDPRQAAHDPVRRDAQGQNQLAHLTSDREARTLRTSNEGRPDLVPKPF